MCIILGRIKNHTVGTKRFEKVKHDKYKSFVKGYRKGFKN